MTRKDLPRINFGQHKPSYVAASYLPGGDWPSRVIFESHGGKMFKTADLPVAKEG
jgi:hypothetical protein